VWGFSQIWQIIFDFTVQTHTHVERKKEERENIKINHSKVTSTRHGECMKDLSTSGGCSWPRRKAHKNENNGRSQRQDNKKNRSLALALHIRAQTMPAKVKFPGVTQMSKVISRQIHQVLDSKTE
jgi:hypothetical protein